MSYQNIRITWRCKCNAVFITSDMMMKDWLDEECSTVCPECKLDLLQPNLQQNRHVRLGNWIQSMEGTI